MKKIYLLLVLSALSGFSIAQRNVNVVKEFNNKIGMGKTPNDTLYPLSCLQSQTQYLYGVYDGGYLCGNNYFGDLEKAERFRLSYRAAYIEGVIIWFGYKSIVNAPDSVSINLYKNNGEGTSVSGTVNNAPGTLLRTYKIATNNVDTSNHFSGANIFAFSPPVFVNSNLSIGVNFSQLTDDTIAIVSTAAGTGDSLENAWERHSDGKWYSMFNSWGENGDLDMFIAAIVDTTVAGVDDNYFINGIKLDQNQPNPASNNTLIQYEIQNNTAVSLEIFDASGKSILFRNEGMQGTGEHNILISTSNFPKGIYYYCLSTGSKRLAKKMIIE